MKGRHYLAFFGCFLATIGSAQTDSFTLNDGIASYAERNLFGGRTASSSGQGEYRVRGIQSPVQNWWWYRAGEDSREFALSNQVSFEQLNPNFVTLTYDEPVTGVGDDTLRFVLSYELTQLDAITARLFIGFGITNLSAVPIQLSFFSYFDVDLASTALDDSAVVSGEANEVQTVSDGAALASMDYIASTRRLVGYEMGSYNGILSNLSNGTATNLTNSGSPFGPGDWTGAFQWDVDIAPGDVTFIGSITKQITVVPEPSSLLALSIGMLIARRLRKREA